MSPRFLAAHLPVLAAGVFLVVLGKGLLVRRFRPLLLSHVPRCNSETIQEVAMDVVLMI